MSILLYYIIVELYDYIYPQPEFLSTANLPTNIVDFGGLDSSTILILRGGIPRPIGIP